MTAEPTANSFRFAVLSGRAGRHDNLVVRTKRGRVDSSAEGLAAVSVPRSEERRSNQRDADRHRLSSEQALVRNADGEHVVALVNLSAGGAMISGPLAVMLWDHVGLVLGGEHEIDCAVRWIKGDKIGLEFAHETRLDCDEEMRDELLRAVIRKSFPDLTDDPLHYPHRRADDDPDVAADEAQRRSATRHPLIWNGVLHHDYQSTPVRIRNISKSGAMIESAMPVRVGAEPLLELNDSTSVSATVEWTVGDHAGLSFHSPFDMSLLAHSTPRVTPAEWVRPAYLETTEDAEEDSPWDPRWNRLTLSELQKELEGFLKR